MSFNFNGFKFKQRLNKNILTLVSGLMLLWLSNSLVSGIVINTGYAEMMSTSGLLNIQWRFKEWIIISEKQYLVIYTKLNSNQISDVWVNVNGKDYGPYSSVDTNKDKFFLNSDNSFWFVARKNEYNDIFILNWKEYSKSRYNTYYSLSQSKNHSIIGVNNQIYIDWTDIWTFKSVDWYSFFIWNDWTYSFSYADWIYSNWIKFSTSDTTRSKIVRNWNGSFGFVNNWKTYIKLNLDLNNTSNKLYLDQIKGNWIIKEWGLIEFNYDYADSFTFSKDWKHYSFIHNVAINVDGKDVNIISGEGTNSIKYQNHYNLPMWKDWREILSKWWDWGYSAKTSDKLSVIVNWIIYDLPNDREIQTLYLIKWGFIAIAKDKLRNIKLNITGKDIVWNYGNNVPNININEIWSYIVTTILKDWESSLNNNWERYWPFKRSISNIVDDPNTKHFSASTSEWVLIDWKIVRMDTKYFIEQVNFNSGWYWTTSARKLLVNWKEFEIPNSIYKIKISDDDKFGLIWISTNSNLKQSIWILKLTDIFQPKKTETLSWTLVNTWSIQSGNKNDILLKDWMYPNYEAVYNDNLSRLTWILTSQKSSINSTKKNQLLLSHLDVDGYQSYPYVTDTPNINSMDENNSFLTFITVPTDYEIKSISIWTSWWKEFITKIWWNCWNWCFKVLITPTKDRVMKTMSIWDKKDYDVNIIYSIAMWEEKAISIKNGLTYKFWFNFERDAFQFNNSLESFEKWLPSLLLLKIAFPELKILNKWQELKFTDLRNNNFKNWKMSLADIDISYPGIYNEKINSILLWMKLEFIGYCFWITKKWTELLSDKKILTVNNANNISDIKIDSVLTDFNSKITTQENLFFYDDIGYEWMKQITNINTKSKFSGISLNKEKILPINISYISKLWAIHWHSVLWYKYDEIKNLSRYKLFINSSNNAPVLMFDSDNNWLFSENECLIKDKSMCSITRLKQINLNKLTIIYTYDNNFNDYYKSNIFIYNDTNWTLNTIDNYHWSISDDSLKLIKTWDRKSFSTVLDNLEKKFLK